MREVKDNIKKAFARHRLDVLSGYKEIPFIEIPIIPKEWSPFFDSETDKWKLLETYESENKTSCIYELGPKGTFNTHKHEFKKETCKLLTPNAKVEWVTERNITFHSYEDTFEALAGEEHALVSLVDFPIQLEVTWHPKMVGWSAVFRNINAKNNLIK